MKKGLVYGAGLLLLCAVAGWADDHYVSPAGTNNSPYTNWADASTNIQAAVNVTLAGEPVGVTNGTYTLTNQINILTNITLQSVNGTNFTFINGNFPQTINRCVYMTNGVLDGFTISNGFASGGSGGGILISNAGSVLNSVIYRNYCSNDAGTVSGGGGIFLYLPNTTASIVSNCAIVSNIVYIGTNAGSSIGGGIRSRRGTIVASYIAGNRAYNSGGIFLDYTLITNCMVTDNLATNRGGGSLSFVSMVNCVISNNVASGNATGIGDIGGIWCYASIMCDSIIIKAPPQNQWAMNRA